MAGVNKVIILGNLGADPELRSSPSGITTCRLSIATSMNWTDKNSGEKKEKTEWHRIVFFGRSAEVLDQYVKKGQQLYVEGRLQTRKWQDKDGVEKYSTDIISDNFTFVGSKSDSVDNPAPQKNQENSDFSNQDIIKDEDIPF